MTVRKKDEAMRYKMTVKKGRELEAEDYVITPQHPTGPLLVQPIAEIEGTDDGKWIEVTTDDGLIHLVSPDDRVLVVFDTESNGVKMKRIWENITIEEGMKRLVSFIQDTHGAQDWENTVYNLQDYLAAFIGAKGTEVYQDLMGRLDDINAK
jgi:hypothetical protein